MTNAAITVMSVSVGTIVLLFLFCITKVLIAPAAEDDE